MSQPRIIQPQTPAQTDPEIKLTQEQVDFFHREGYLALDAITTPEELQQLREWYDSMFDRRAGRERGEQFDLAGTDEDGKEASLPQILNPEKQVPQFAQTLMRANAVALSKQLLGEDATGHGAHCIFKPAKIGASTPWHQDEAYWNPLVDHRALSIWVPLQEATIENGCMWFVPRSHKMAVLEHQSINNDPRIHGLELTPDQMPYVQDPVACPLPPGGCTIHYSRTLHYTGPNTSDIPRRAYILGGSAPAERRSDGRRFPWLEQQRTARMQRQQAAQP